MKSGNITFLNTAIDGPGKTYYPGDFDIMLASSADVSAGASLSGVEGTYAFGASKQLGVSLSYSPGSSIDIQSISQPIRTSRTVPDFSGIDLGFTAGITPKVGLKFSYSILEQSPVWSRKSIATVDGNIAMPFSFEIDLSRGTGLSGVVGVKGSLSGDIKLLELWPTKAGGWTWDLGSKTFLDVKSSNLFG